jgi:carnitine-CoA ligase
MNDRPVTGGPPQAGKDATEDRSIGARLLHHADQRGDAVAATWRGPGNWDAVGYAELDDRAARAAAVLADLGVRRGDAVHLQMVNSVDFLVCLFAVNRLGGITVPTSPSATVDDVAYVASHAECLVSVTDSAAAAVVLSAREMVPEITHVVVVGEGPDEAVDLHAAMAASEARPGAVGTSGDIATILYTSGTSGWPKGVMLTNRNLLFAGEAVAAHVRMRPEDRWLVSLPLFHLNALGYSTMSALATGGSIVLLDHFTPESWVEAAATSGATLGSLFAVHVRQLLAAAPSRADRSPSLRMLLFAQHLTTDERSSVEDRFGPVPLQVYGMTETIAPTIADEPYGPVRADTLGRATLWASLKVADRAGREVPDGSSGELLVRGEPGRTLMAGYYRRPEETALVLRNGWLRTGDHMLREADERYRFLGRATEVIKPGVDNVSAPEIERVLYENISVADASVVGVRTPSGDEAIVAFVVLLEAEDATAEELISWCSERLADYKVPHRILIVDELPRNAVGKVLKRHLQTRATAVLNPGEP